jgi:hypothetical protein
MASQGLTDPRKSTPGQFNLDKSFRDFYARCKQADPAPKPQLAIPNSTVRWISFNYGRGPTKKMRVTGNLITMAFFFLLRVGEYTPHRPSESRRTIPLRKRDIKLWKRGRRIPNEATLAELLSADAVTICLENQKNGHKNAVLHHTTSGDPLFDPVIAAAHLVFELRHSPDTVPLGSFVDDDGVTKQIAASDIRAAIRVGALADNLEAAGYDLDRIGSHSLRSGGAVHLKLCGYDEDMIKKLGRWSSNTYLRYIQTQIANLTAGVAANMGRFLRFENVGA